MKKIGIGFLGLLLILTIICCESKQKITQDKLVLGFVPLIDAEKLIETADPLSQILTSAIGIPVETYVATNYIGVVEALGSGKVDFAIIPPFAYALAHKTSNAKVILSALNKKGTASYRSEFLVRSNSSITSLGSLKGKKIAFVDPSSSSGYIFPCSFLIKNGVDVEKDLKYVYSGGHDKSIQLLLNGDVDIIAVYENARTKMEKDFPDVLTKTRVLTYTDDIPFVTVVVRGDMDQKMQERIKVAIMGSLNDGKGKALSSKIFGLYGFIDASDKDYDSVRTAAEIMNIDLNRTN